MTRCGSVLVVDDGEINRTLLTELLEHEGYEVREAPAALENSPVDTVLLDWTGCRRCG